MSNDKNLSVCMISGSFEYDSEASLTIFRNYIERHYAVQPTMIIYQTEDDDPSLEPLEHTDVLVLFTRRLNTRPGMLAANQRKNRQRLKLNRSKRRPWWQRKLRRHPLKPQGRKYNFPAGMRVGRLGLIRVPVHSKLSTD